MENLTLIIPAKYEEASLPLVLKEIKNLNCKIYIILEKTDLTEHQNSAIRASEIVLAADQSFRNGETIKL